MRRLAFGLLFLVLLTACGDTAKDYRKPDQLAGAVKSELTAEGKHVDRVTCLQAAAGEFACAYKLASGLAAIRHVTVAPDGKTWSQGY